MITVMKEFLGRLRGFPKRKDYNIQESLPDFLIVGAIKAGTTACGYNLSKHPDIFMVTKEDKLRYCNKKSKKIFNSEYFNHGEIGFFIDKNLYNMDADWYSGFFKNTRCSIKGEKTPQYLYSDYNFQDFNTRTCDRIKELLPDIKIIILLRDPVNRAFSHWNHIQDQLLSSTRKFHHKSFYDCINATENNILLSGGNYYRNVLDYLSTFGDHRVLIAIQERVIANMQSEYMRMFKFLGASKKDNLEFSIIHKRDYKKMQPDTTSIDILKEHYSTDVIKLKKLLQDDLPEWRDY